MARGMAGLFAVAAAALPFQSKVKRNSKLRNAFDPSGGSLGSSGRVEADGVDRRSQWW